MNSGTVIGWFASKRGAGQFCDDHKALVVCGSQVTLRKAITSRGADPSTFMYEKARMGDIAAALQMGGAYAFDREAYERFAPEGASIGIPKQDFDFTPSQPGLIKFIVLDPRT